MELPIKMREAIGKGSTVILAKQEACNALGVEDGKVEFEVVQLPEKKIFGFFGGKPAKVKAIIKDSPSDAALDYLKEIILNFGITDIDIKVEDLKKHSVFNISGSGAKELFGGKIETLRAMQYLIGLVASQKNGSFYNIVITAENLKDDRVDKLDKDVKVAIDKFIKTKKNISLVPMHSYDRKVIHEKVQKLDGVESWSEGEGFKRHIVIGVRNPI